MNAVATERVPVAFRGEGEGTGELSWGQQAIWKGMSDSGDTLTMSAVRKLNPGATVGDFVSELCFYLSRYEAMRTLFRFGPDGHVLQVVYSSGTAEIEIYDAGDRDPAGLAAEVDTFYATKPFDYQREWPLRYGLVRHAGVLTHAVVAIGHHVADGVGAMSMAGDWFGQDRVTGQPPRTPGIQPLAQAKLQQTAAVRRLNDAALRYWEEQLRVIPPTMFPAASPSEAGVLSPGRFVEAEYSSPALLLALHAVAAGLGVSTGAVLYAAFAGALAATTGVGQVATTVMVNNRFRPGLANAGGPMAQLGLCTLEVEDTTFPDLVLRARNRLLSAQKYAYYAPHENDELVERIGRQRGVTFDLRCMFNDRRNGDGPIKSSPDHSEIRASVPATTVSWREVSNLHQRLMIHVNEDPAALKAAVQVDTAYLSRHDVDTFLQRMQTTVLNTALGE